MNRCNHVERIVLLPLLCTLVCTLGIVSLSTPAHAAPSQAATALLKSWELDELVQPIALYPDSLLKAILPASTFPDQLVDAVLLIRTPADAPKIKDQAWDDSVKVVATYPGVLKMLFDELEWTEKLGKTFLAQHQDVFNAIQRGRTNAKSKGQLKSNEYQTVTTETAPTGDTVIIVQPTNPEVVYVPQETTVVSGTSSTESALVPLATFGLGMALGAAISDDDDDNYYYGGGPVYWHDDDHFDDFVDHRKDMWEDYDDRRRDQQDFRQDKISQRQDFRQDMVEDGKWPAQGSEQAQKRKQQAQQRANDYKQQNPSASRGQAKQQAQTRANQYKQQNPGASREQARQQAGQSAQNRAQSAGQARDPFSSGSRVAGTSWNTSGASRSQGTRPSGGYGGASSYSRPSPSSFNRGSSSFSGYNSGARASAASSRGSMSRGGGGGGRRR